MDQSLPDPTDGAPQEREQACPEHGAFTSRFVGLRGTGGYWQRCRACASEQEAEWLAVETRRREQKERERRRAWLADSGIDARFADATLEPPVGAADSQRRALAACRQFAQSIARMSGGGLALLGPTGVGKTHMCAGMLRHLILQCGVRAHLVTARGITREIRSTWRRGAQESEAELIERHACISVLFVDDIGAGFGTEAEAVHLLDVIDARYRARRPTVFTSNLTLPELRALVGDRVFDRLLDGSAVVVCDWPSMRRLGRPLP